MTTPEEQRDTTDRSIKVGLPPVEITAANIVRFLEADGAYDQRRQRFLGRWATSSARKKTRVAQERERVIAGINEGHMHREAQLARKGRPISPTEGQPRPAHDQSFVIAEGLAEYHEDYAERQLEARREQAEESYLQFEVDEWARHSAEAAAEDAARNSALNLPIS